MRTPPLVALSLAVIAASACGGTAEFEPTDAEGPPRFEPTTARAHAQQFEDPELADRPAGSAAEQAANVYLLGVLQRNGYISRLDAVPVRDLYSSTNVIAQPRTGGEPQIVVVVPSDTPPGGGDTAPALGAFLEVSRALNVADPEHRVHFAAVGSDHAEVESGRLGSRRLAQLLLDQGFSPEIVELVERDPDVFSDAGFERTLITGDIEEIGAELFDYLLGSS